MNIRDLLVERYGDKPLTNFDIVKHARSIRNFRGVFMRDELPEKLHNVECGIVNLDESDNAGTHWVAYYVGNHARCYFDSFGLDPPIELTRYLGRKPILVQTFQLQGYDDFICGHLCLHVLIELDNNQDFKDVVLALV